MLFAKTDQICVYTQLLNVVFYFEFIMNSVYMLFDMMILNLQNKAEFQNLKQNRRNEQSLFSFKTKCALYSIP